MMADQPLPYPPTEARFWQNVAREWVRSPGLVTVVVPEDLNQLVNARWVRDYACRAVGMAVTDFHPVSDHRSTYCYCLSSGRDLLPADGGDVLAKVIHETGKESEVMQAARGEKPFYLAITGLSLPTDASLHKWIGVLASSWPGPRPGSDVSQLHVFCLITAPWQHSMPPLSEGCTLMVPGEGTDEEIALVARASIEETWTSHEISVQHYLCSVIADMSSGRRPHAELALEHLTAEWEHATKNLSDWRPNWRTGRERLSGVRDILSTIGLDRAWLQGRFSIHPSAVESQEMVFAAHLWARGLWRSNGDAVSLWGGLTSLARAALAVGQDGEWLIPPFTPLSSIRVLRRCQQLERNIKHLLFEALAADTARKRIRQALDAPSRQDPELSLRELVAQQRSDWQGSLPPDAMKKDHIVIGICSFGLLRDIVLDLCPAQRIEQMRKSLSVLVRARNLVAHCGWLSLGEFREVCAAADSVESVLSRLQLG